VINIKRKEDCTGCSACVDCCGQKAITLETDMEGFWYPHVSSELCVNCGLCEETCPELHIEELKKDGAKELPIVFAAYHKDPAIRYESSSGGLFSALANQMYEEGGYVGGAVYTEDFSIEHIVTNKREDLVRIRGTKHAQSDMTGIFQQVNTILNEGGKVLICGAPCQMAGLRLFLGRQYQNLITIDFICLGISSPKIHRKRLESLESEHGAKVVSVKAKNKDHGWKSIGYKISFANGKVYQRAGARDGFVRGLIDERCNCRPVCYECKYKGFPRVSDISLGDFWGIENVEKTMDDDMGTSVVLLNSQKGIVFFNSTKINIETKEVSLRDVLPGNRALSHPIVLPTINRDEYFKDMDTYPFDVVVKKHFPSNGNVMNHLHTGLTFIGQKITQMGYHPRAYMQLFWINFLRKNTLCAARKAWLIFPARYAILDIHKQAQISIKGPMLFGYKRIRGSKMESRLAVEGNGSLIVERGHVTIYYGSDILVFKGASLCFKGSAAINQSVQIICMDSITIGDDVMISRDVIIRDNDGGHEILTEGYKKTAPVTIGDHVWIGQGAMIMKGVNIGDGAIISAGAWVATDVKPNALVMGDPARAVKKNVEWKV
jgi:acetyltransferase-like isoleucine patch superfamily enzyme/coenzyme F420-reducing hydrogenase beta subunit